MSKTITINFSEDQKKVFERLRNMVDFLKVPLGIFKFGDMATCCFCLSKIMPGDHWFAISAYRHIANFTCCVDCEHQFRTVQEKLDDEFKPKEKI